MLIAACSPAGEGDGSMSPSIGAAAADTVRLEAGGEAHLPGRGLRIRLVAVESDSRCPVDVTCVRAGDAAVRLQIRGSIEAPLRLHTTEPGHSAVLGHDGGESLRVSRARRRDQSSRRGRR